MKNLRFLLLLITPFLLAMSCDDDPSNDTPSGTWSLVHVTGGFAGVDEEFPEGAVTWKFGNFNGNRKVTVVNNNPEDAEAEDFFDTGVYNYRYVDNALPNSCQHTTEIDGINFGCQNQSGQTLILAQTEADGYTLTFKKI